MLLVLLSTPAWATTTPIAADSLLIEPNPYLPLLIAVLFGIGDNCVNTARTVICALILRDKRAEVFAISKFHQTLLLATVMFLSPVISVHVYFAIMLVYGIATVFLYRSVLNDVDEKELLDSRSVSITSS
ncbi:hypothetical protein PRIPAC_80857 [Pristionchus pacificus]|uniref:Uncharacterized protein n=1 Tax=Pristionchus pacificus TaxID=54126 RepID=A0A454Y188_PRIPA|nr:hypothetical protein PRIPAC_80857 [Pristionchus pacificus]|eukprot:PDM79434.1 hypothetical protein PRIPAC_32013 [Pristionchus pacificus]